MKTFCVKYRKYTDKYTENIHDMAYGKSKDLAKKLNQNFFFRYNAFKIASDWKYDAYKRGLASMVYKFFDKKFSGSGVDAEPNYELASELHKQIIKKFKRRKKN